MHNTPSRAPRLVGHHILLLYVLHMHTRSGLLVFLSGVCVCVYVQKSKVPGVLSNNAGMEKGRGGARGTGMVLG